jgi:hypothetical protein
MSSALVVPGHDLMNAPAAARDVPRPCRGRLPNPTTTTVITMSLLTTMNRLMVKAGVSSAVDDMLHQLVDYRFAFLVCGKRLDRGVRAEDRPESTACPSSGSAA